MNVTWTGGASDATVVVTGSSSGAGKISATFVCTSPAAARSFEVPLAVTLALPASVSAGPATIPGAGAGSLLVSTSTYTRFTAPGLDQGVFTSSGGTLKTLNSQ